MVFCPSLSLSISSALNLNQRDRVSTPPPTTKACYLSIYPLFLSSDLAQIMPKIAFDVKHIRSAALFFCFSFLTFIVNYLIYYTKKKSLQNFPAYFQEFFLPKSLSKFPHITNTKFQCVRAKRRTH